MCILCTHRQTLWTAPSFLRVLHLCNWVPRPRHVKDWACELAVDSRLSDAKVARQGRAAPAIPAPPQSFPCPSAVACDLGLMCRNRLHAAPDRFDIHSRAECAAVYNVQPRTVSRVLVHSPARRPLHMPAPEFSMQHCGGSGAIIWTQVRLAQENGAQEFRDVPKGVCTPSHAARALLQRSGWIEDNTCDQA